MRTNVKNHTRVEQIRVLDIMHQVNSTLVEYQVTNKNSAVSDD